jgi:hypothetical protein
VRGRSKTCRHYIDLADPRRFERSLEIPKEVVASPTTNDPRAAGQVEPKVCVRDEQHTHVTPTRGQTPGARPRAEVRRLVAVPRGHPPQRDV